ncbi:MAG: hypothetical protein LLG44_09060 [Chloroflexi bacterium]|nr:hypothetical protein [Chloroflexota bacterium]
MENTKSRKVSWFWSGEEPEWLVIVTVLTALLIGGFLMFLATGRTDVLTLDKLRVSYPAQWLASEEEPPAFMAGAQDLTSQASVAIIIHRKLDPQAPVTMDDLATEFSFELAQNTQLFRVLETKSTQVNSNNAVMVSYAYVLDSATSSYQSALPRVIKGAAYLIPYQGLVYLVNFQNEAAAWQEGSVQRMVKSIRFEQ